jgi:hypothetical protein
VLFIFSTDHEHSEVRGTVVAIVGSVIRITTYTRQYRYTSAGNDLIMLQHNMLILYVVFQEKIISSDKISKFVGNSK